MKLLKIPKPQLYAGILIFATVGAYGMRQSAFDLVLLYGIGVFGVLMRRFDFPTAPVVVGMILGPLAEAQLRNAVSIGEGSFMVFLQRPMSLGLIILRHAASSCCPGWHGPDGGRLSPAGDILRAMVGLGHVALPDVHP